MDVAHSPPSKCIKSIISTIRQTKLKELNPKQSKFIKEDTIEEISCDSDVTQKNISQKNDNEDMTNLLKIPAEKEYTEMKIIFIFKNEKNNINFNLNEIINACPIVNKYNSLNEAKVRLFTIDYFIFTYFFIGYYYQYARVDFS